MHLFATLLAFYARQGEAGRGRARQGEAGRNRGGCGSAGYAASTICAKESRSMTWWFTRVVCISRSDT